MDDTLLATLSTNMPNTVFIWDISTLELKFVLNH